MTPTELTAIIGGIAAVLGAPGFVTYLNRRSKAPSMATVAAEYRQERDRLEKKIDDMSLDHEKKLNEAEARWRKQHEEDQAQIRRLREEVDSLYRRLYGGQDSTHT